MPIEEPQSEFAVSELDPFSTEFLSNPVPYHHMLRELGQAVRLEKYGIWALARYTEVRNALQDWKTFCSGRGAGLSDFEKEEPWRPPSIILEADPPLHSRTRAVLSKVMSSSAMEKLRTPFEAKAEALCDELVARGAIDGVKDLAEAYPLSVFPDTVGVTKQGRENLLPYGDMAFNAFGPRNHLFEASFANAQQVASWIIAQCDREALSPDGFGAQIYAQADAGRVSEQEAALLVRSLLTAGLDTTIAALGATIHCLATHEEQWHLLRKNPSLARSAFEEAVRFASPVQTFFRTTTCEAQVADTRIPSGEKVLLFLAAANRDPREWQQADTFDIQRVASGHVGFGYGIHMCVGRMVARLEAEALLNALVKRVESIEMTDAPVWRLNNTLRILERLPLRLRASN